MSNKDIIKSEIKGINTAYKKTCSSLEQKYKIKKVDIDLYLEEQARIVFDTQSKIKKIYNRLKEENFTKSKLPDIASEFFIYYKHLRNFIEKETHSKLVKETDFSQLNEIFMEEIEKKTRITSDEFNFIKKAHLKIQFQTLLFKC